MGDSTYTAVHRPEGFQFPLNDKWKIEELSDDDIPLPEGFEHLKLNEKMEETRSEKQAEEENKW
eukprot:CAMPEP_0201511816 /NCGR_PEP_ID=MMETSP0161_2-20130828/4210_1 /ASSEMBLY_ACC=CAM_ASM_000251 /TAXON_ID=180227 /ORGANISM="Neoparamoeba aestuarina, Strain SoJaBio B1-5/56/2" /LENGTH=63 /DNA_ID=CAMNT_0047907445 /DNA_START=86 /DNA_END=274 /DNA_ORIENTATION=+